MQYTLKPGQYGYRHPNILLATGELVFAEIQIYGGACLTGQPTAYIKLAGRLIWIQPGKSVDFVEVE